MIVIQYIEPQAWIPVYDDFSERAPRLFPKLRASRSPGIPFAERYLPVDIGNFTDYRPFLSTDLPVRASVITQLGRLEIPITES